MKRIAIAAVALAALTLTASAASVIAVATGCSDYDDYKALVRFIVEHDRAAFEKYALSHDCRAFDKGAKIIVSEPGFNSSCIREPGNTTCYWVSNVFIKPY